jgi:SAM-dependent methyltransferase
VLKWLTRAARELNWARRAWSTDSDREFHEELYRAGQYDPFSWDYPGYTTIRRFADVVEPHLPASGLVVDLGCGPGEITCELAGRRTGLAFLGLDHSAAAIAKARANAARRGVANVRFDARNVEEYVPDGRVDLVTLFDSFHHLTTPAAFVGRLSPHVTRWALIEPRGSWAGTWQKDIDLDWLAHELDKIRARVAGAVGATGATGATGAKRARREAPRSPPRRLSRVPSPPRERPAPARRPRPPMRAGGLDRRCR